MLSLFKVFPGKDVRGRKPLQARAFGPSESASLVLVVHSLPSPQVLPPTKILIENPEIPSSLGQLAAFHIYSYKWPSLRLMYSAAYVSHRLFFSYKRHYCRYGEGMLNVHSICKYETFSNNSQL